MNQKAVGTGGFILSFFIMAALSTLSYFFMSAEPVEGDMGLCFNSPNNWEIPPFISWIINNVLIFAIAVGILLLNRKYIFIKGHDLLTPCVYLILTACNPWTTLYLGESTLLAAANIICWSILFNCYRSRNATQQIFIVASILSVGSMIQYAFIFMIPVYFFALIILKTLRWKEFLAMGLGLIAPYWIVLGLGIVPPEALSIQFTSNLFINFAPPIELTILLLSVAATMLISLLVAINNSIKLFAGNSKVLAMNNIILLTGLICGVLIIVDFNNMFAYLGTFYLFAGVQAGNLFTLNHFRYPQYILGPLLILYLGIFGLLIWPR